MILLEAKSLGSLRRLIPGIIVVPSYFSSSQGRVWFERRFCAGSSKLEITVFHDRRFKKKQYLDSEVGDKRAQICYQKELALSIESGICEG